MELIRGLLNLKQHHKECVATVGNFDGVHRGHQAVIEQLKALAAKHDLPTAVLIFEPQPIEHFLRGEVPARLTSLREKIEQFIAQGIDLLVCLRFDEILASFSAEQFVKELLVDGLAVHSLVVGDDFRFGKGRTGNFKTLVSLGKTYGFDVYPTGSLCLDDERVSSTLIRDALEQDDFDKASRLLGRQYSISGRVVHGDKRGKTLGYPTANVELHRMLTPVSGIFAARALGIEEQGLESAVYIGTRPVFHGRKTVLEVHILDFDKDVYGKHMRVELLKEIRGDAMFDSKTELQEQIAKDVEDVRNYFSADKNI